MDLAVTYRGRADVGGNPSQLIYITVREPYAAVGDNPPTVCPTAVAYISYYPPEAAGYAGLPFTVESIRKRSDLRIIENDAGTDFDAERLAHYRHW